MNKHVLLFPSYCSTKALKIVSLNGFQRYSFLPMNGFDVIIKKMRTADDVTRILMTLQLKYPITLTEKHFWRYGLEYLMAKCWRLRIVW
jgi:hypothetical protein